jgi:hypothetical protein
MLHPNVLVFKILKYLQERSEAVSEERLREAVGIPPEDFIAVSAALKANARIEYDAGYYKFRPLFKIVSMDDLRSILLNDPSSGVRSEDIQRPSVVSELRTMKGCSGEFIVVDSKGANFTAFLNDLKHEGTPAVIKRLWHEDKGDIRSSSARSL